MCGRGSIFLEGIFHAVLGGLQRGGWETNMVGKAVSWATTQVGRDPPTPPPAKGGRI